MRILAIIPARGGSVRLPGKNIRLLGNKPLIQWTIEAAKNVAAISRVFVSTDCEKIAKVSRAAGIEVPFLRPESLSKNDSTSIDVIKHVVEFCAEIGEDYDFVMLLQPTSPFRNSRHIQEAIDTMISKCADGVISVCKCDHSPLWANTLPDDLSMDEFVGENIKNLRSQDLPDFYMLNGAIYLVKIEKLYAQDSVLLDKNAFGFEMDSISSVDIDTEFDFLVAESILSESLNE